DVTWTVESGSGCASHLIGGEFNILGAGTVTVSATKSGNENYESAFDIITIEIHKAVQYDFSIVAPGGVTYGDKDVVLTAKNGLGSGVLTWSVVEGGSYAKIDPVSGALEIKGAGTVVITATKAGDANYESAYDTITLEIHKAVQNALSITGIPTGVLTINTQLRLGTAGGSSGENVVWSYVGNVGNIELDPNTGVGKILGVGDGTAIITARKPGGDNYYDISTTITLYIDKTNQAALIINVPSGIIYEKDKIITLTCTGGTTNGKVTWSVQSSDPEKLIAVINESTGELTIKGAGTVTVYATMAGNEDYYAATASTAFTINKANQSALTIKTNRVLNGITFGDTGIVFSIEGGSSGGNVTWEVLSGSDIVGIDSNGALTIFHASKSSGDITICATMAGGDNYYDTSATVSFTVNKANQSPLIIKAPGGITFGDTDVVFTVEGGSVGGNAIWRVVGGSDIVDIQSSSGALIIKHASLSDNDVTVSATLPGDDNYYDITTYFTFTVKKANQTALTITTNSDFNGITFGDTGIVFSTSGGSTNGNITWQVLRGSDIVGIGPNGALTIKHASKTSGDVTIVATMDGDRDYYAISTSITFTVNKANQPPLTISIGDNQNGITFGDTGVVLSAVGGRAGGIVTWSVLEGADIVSINPSGGTLTIKRASRSDNDVTIRATVSGGDDYYDTFATITFTVNKANQPALIIDAPNGISYGDNVVLSYSGGRAGGTVVWSVPSGSCTEIDSITGALDILRVGEVTITAFMAGGDNYLDTSATVTFIIKKANQGAFMIKGLPSSVTFGEGTLTLTAEGGSDNGDVEWVVVSGNAFVEHIGRGVFTIKGAGDVTITATKYGGDNYYDTSATVSFTVNKANQEAFRIIDLPNTVVFGDGTFTLKTDGGWEGGTVFWSVVSGTGFVSPEGEGVFKIIGAGEVIISATKTGGNNYYDISTSIRLLIEKATPDVTLPDALTAQYGDTLGDIALPQGWTWMDSALSVGGIGVRGFGAVYTPSDTANYNTVTAVLTITVVKGTPVYTLPTALTATYGDTLGDVALPAGWAWNDALTTKVGNAGVRTFTATFTPSDTENYETVTVALTITVQKAIPQFTIPDGLKATVGDTLGDVALPAGWAWNDALTTKVGKAGKRTFTATFTPSDTENYETVTVTLSIAVEDEQSGFWWWWIVLLIAILILIFFVVLLLVRNRKKESNVRR
ncbi:MAG: hypothetical protein J1F69_04540, partial [Clostridiales bacterium]|nr:hypothetical protein [Clostridiales bacterium]